MADNPHLRGGADRSRVSANQENELRYFAEKFGLTENQVRTLIDRHGNDRDTLEREAVRLKH